MAVPVLANVILDLNLKSQPDITTIWLKQKHLNQFIENFVQGDEAHGEKV